MPTYEKLRDQLHVLIETVEEGLMPCDGGRDSWEFARKAKKGAKQIIAPRSDNQPLDAYFLQEEHHHAYGRPWFLGKYQMQFLKQRGLQPHHTVLDYGCGAGRLGVRVIQYLDPGHYYGLDIHRRSLEAFAEYEIPLWDLEEKRPRLLHDAESSIEYFGTQFDWIVDFYSSVHNRQTEQKEVFRKFSQFLKPGGRLLTAPKPRIEESILADQGWVLVHQEIQACPLLEGHGFSPENDWFEYRLLT